MKIRSVHVRRFRSIAAASLTDCGGLNVLIGKNNAGKSSFLRSIELILEHLAAEGVTRPWPLSKLREEFNNRETARAIQIGVEFTIAPDTVSNLTNELRQNAPHLVRSIDEIRSNSTIAFVIAADYDPARPFTYLQQLGIGNLSTEAEDLTILGTSLFELSRPVAAQLHEISLGIAAIVRDVKAVEDLLERQSSPAAREYPARFLVAEAERGSAAGGRIERYFSGVKDGDDLQKRAALFLQEHREKLEPLLQKQTDGSIMAFAGPTKTVPPYVQWLMRQYGSINTLHLRETKLPIGREEAAALLRLKVKRGGPERLRVVQETVQTLLGVDIDAFEPEDVGPRERRLAEMDIDNFLVEANGAGVREALRLILDIELKEPMLVLLEEPEVHLHPGLARAVESYLRSKSALTQLFVTTHSTQFVDAVSFQNVYLVSRNEKHQTVTEAVSADAATSIIPREIGLRLSTVFMYDKLVFVEGPSDEEVLKHLALLLDINLARANVGFVHMAGVRNFGNFAVEKTLDLLSRRQIDMWFVLDRDERDSDDVKKMRDRLGSRAKLADLERRELENYLLDPAAVMKFIIEKHHLANKVPPIINEAEIAVAIREEAVKLKAEVAARRLAHRLLKPVFVKGSDYSVTAESWLQKGIEELQHRLTLVEPERQVISEAIDQDWPARASDNAPGDMILDNLAKHYGVRFNKEAGDSLRLARHLSGASVPQPLKNILNQIGTVVG